MQQDPQVKLQQLKQQTIIYPPQAHQNTVIWIHGLDNKHFNRQITLFTQTFSKLFANTKVVLPWAPIKYVTAQQSQTTSWFDIKFRNEKSFTVDFDEAFSSKEVKENYENILKKTILREKNILNQVNPKGKLLIGGFSQGCGMALHSFYNNTDLVEAVVGVAGYLFPFSPFDEKYNDRVLVLYGNNDKLRPWQYVKTTYQGKLPQNRIKNLEGMKHQFLHPNTLKQLEEFFSKYLKQ